MNIQLSPNALDHLRYWADTHPRTLSKILDLIECIRRDPYEGVPFAPSLPRLSLRVAGVGNVPNELLPETQY